jgi:hypothetical protein
MIPSGALRAGYDGDSTLWGAATDPRPRLEFKGHSYSVHLTNEEIKGLEEHLTLYEDIFAETDEDYGRTNKVY